MSRREEFKARMKELKQYRDTTGKGYWEWKLHSKVNSYALGGDNEEDGEDGDVFAQFTKENPMQPGSVAPKDLAEQNRIQNLPYEQNEYQKQFAKAWYTQRAKYSKYDSQLGGGKLGRILETIGKSTYQTIPEFAETELKEYMRINSIDKQLSPIEIKLKSEQLQNKDAMGFARPSAYAWHVKPKTIKTPRVDYRGLGWHEGIGHIVGDNSTEIMGSAPKIWIKNQLGDKEYEKYINQQNEQHASTWEFRGANAEMLDDNGKRYIDPNRQLTPYDIRRMKEKGATMPVEWRNSNITESDIANFLNSFAYQDKPQDTFDFNISNSTNEVFFGKNRGEIPSYEVGGTNEDRQTSIVTNTVKKALERGDIQLVQRILKRGNKEDRKFYYPDNGSIQSVLNIYDTPLLGDALSLLDALKYSVKGDWDNASLSYLDAVSPLALFSKSKLNWKGWGAKKKYIPEYEAIEREAKKNGTWLKNADGTDFTGDPREWVVKRSKKFREAFGDKYLEGYTGIRGPYNPRELLDTYLSSRERAYTYTPNKQQVKKKGDTGIAKLVVPDTDTYTVDALGNDWLHLTDKSINPYDFTNTNQIVSSVQTPVISFKNIRDDGPFGIRDVAEDQFVAKSTTPRKSVLYNNGDFDLSNPDIFKATITPYIGYKLYNKANREEIQSYAGGGETKETEKVNSNSAPSTVDEYITQQILNVKQSALNKSRTRRLPKVPIKYSESEESHQRRNREYIRSLEFELQQKKDLLEYNKRQDGLIYFGHVSDQTKQLQQQIEDLQDKISIGIPRSGEILGPSCAATFADNYNMDFIGSEQFRQNAQKYGFKQKDFKNRKPGDAVLVYNTDADKATHTMMYDSDIDGVPTYNHSNGGVDSQSLRVRGRYPFKEGTIPLIYEYVGTPADSIRWSNEFKVKRYIDGGETENNTDDRTDHPISITQNLDKVLSVADFTDRINHTDPNIGEYNPFYNAFDDTYGTVPLSEVSVTAPWTKLGRNNADARRGMHYVQQGLEDAAKVAAPIVAGAVLPAIASTGALGTITDLASIATNPLDPLNYLPYAKKAASLGKQIKNIIVPKVPTWDLTPDQTQVILNDKIKFLDEMDKIGFEVIPSGEWSQETERIAFVTCPYYNIITPSKNSDTKYYLDWLDKTFNIKTKRHAYVYGRNSFKNDSMGLYYPQSGKVALNSAYSDNIDGVFIHEAGSHGTDDIISDRIIKDYPFKLPEATIKIGEKYPTVSEIYQDITDIKPNNLELLKYRIMHPKDSKNYGVFLDSNSNNWYEGRATLNEIRSKIFFPEFEESPIDAVDDFTDTKIIEAMAGMNAYGYDYKRAYDLLSPSKKKEWMDKVRYALKYLPATTGVAVGLNNNKD